MDANGSGKQQVRRRPINIVPLWEPQPNAPRQTPTPQGAQLTYRGGVLLTAVEVFTIFWGGAWQQAPQSGLISSINQFFDDILGSSLLDQLAEYSVTGKTIGHGRRTGTTTLLAQALRRSVSDATIQKTIQAEIASGAIPQSNANTLYFVYLPPGITVSQGGQRSCQAFCGYHNAINTQIFYAVMPFPNCSGCTSNLTTLDSLTSTSSHELCEAITDPVPGQGWYDDTNGEIGDICAWKTKKLGTHMVQLEWSNKANACI